MSDRWRAFLNAVSEMRRLQREYFRTRKPATLQACKEAEKRVDEMCAALRCGQRSLFPEESTT